MNMVWLERVVSFSQYPKKYTLYCVTSAFFPQYLAEDTIYPNLNKVLNHMEGNDMYVPKAIGKPRHQDKMLAVHISANHLIGNNGVSTCESVRLLKTSGQFQAAFMHQKPGVIDVTSGHLKLRS